MSSYWYRAGLAAVENGNTVVTGTTTYWDSAPNKPMAGDIFTVDMQTLYEIVSVDSDSQITLDRVYEGSTASVEYAIIRNSSATNNTRIAAQVSEVLQELGDKITVSTTAPSPGQGNDGDIWIVVE